MREARALVGGLDPVAEADGGAVDGRHVGERPVRVHIREHVRQTLRYDSS
jgi:hypothetical protein